MTVIISPVTLYAQTSVDERRIEEEKRGNLKTTEPQIEETKEIPASESQTREIRRRYFEELLAKPRAQYADLVYVLTAFFGLEKKYPDFASEYTYLKTIGLIDTSLSPCVACPVRRAELAIPFCKALRIKGGIWLKLFGLTKRYAHKELVYERIMFPGSGDEYISGKELVITFIQAADYWDRHKK